MIQKLNYLIQAIDDMWGYEFFLIRRQLSSDAGSAASALDPANEEDWAYESFPVFSR